MRSDFGRCVIERERRGSRYATSLKLRDTGKFNNIPIDPDDQIGDDFDYNGPTRIPNSPRRMHAINKKLHEKDFTDVLRPIKGYLHKSIGRRWDDVYSELMSVLGRKGHAISHVLYQHLLRDVDTHTYLENGKIYSSNPHYYSGDYYVHPETGRLCREAQYSRKYIPKPTQADTDSIRIPDTARYFVLIKGLWFIGTYVKRAVVIPKYYSCYREAVWPDLPDSFFSKIKQASRKEIKQLRALQAVRNQ